VEAQLEVDEGQSHGQYRSVDGPEAAERYSDIAAFFDRHLGH
jgi:hypothetical protein